MSPWLCESEEHVLVLVLVVMVLLVLASVVAEAPIAGQYTFFRPCRVTAVEQGPRKAFN